MAWARKIKGVVAAGGFLAFAATNAAAEAVPLLKPESYARAVDIYHAVLSERAPGLVAPLVDFSAGAKPAVCVTGRQPSTHAVLVGAEDIGIPRFKLEGTTNDVDLLSTVLTDRGVAPQRIHKLTGAAAKRGQIFETLAKVISEVECGDRVMLHFSAHAVGTDQLFDATISNAGPIVDEADRELFLSKGTISQFLRKLRREVVRLPEADDPDADRAGKIASLQLGSAEDLAILLNDDSEVFNELIRGRDVSDAMIAIRNRGGHAIASFDVEGSPAAAIERRQRIAGDRSAWSFEYAPGGGDYWPALELIPNHGSFTVLYASGIDEVTPELRLPRNVPRDQQKRYGLFSYVVASGLIENEHATARSIGEKIQQAYQADNRRNPHPRIESSDPELVLIAEVQPLVDEPIKILSPSPKRGAAVMEKAEVEIAGLVEWPAKILGVHVGNQPAELEADGRFTKTVALKTGMNVIDIVAISADSRMHRKTLEFVFEGDRKALEGEGKRYAVIIANQNYGGKTGMATLSTPFADADALTALLAGEYGFVTEINAGGRAVPLILKDPTKREIELVLHQVGKVAGAKDTVLIFYAGHGVFEPVTSTAYWVPSDAEAGFEPSYLSAADISAAVQRIQANHLILISDSCYSGALLRGGAASDETIDQTQRMQALLKMQSRRSRIVITSGNNEPVADQGGDGHSVFARALLTGLERMDHDAFSARELFDGYILQQVTANADQEPQYRPLEKAGHEGGDFVFVKAENVD